MSTIVPYFRIIFYWNVQAYALWKGQLDIWPFEERCQLEPFWLLFICVRLPSFWYNAIHQAIKLVQIQIDSVEVNMQPIFRDICFSCSRAITIHPVIAIFSR